MEKYFEIKNLSVGYRKKKVISDINADIEKGSVLSLIGPNGAGKSTILKSIIKAIPVLEGNIFIDGKDIYEISLKEMSKKLSVVLTDRISPEIMTCAEIVAMGRYPYTNMIGHLTDEDKKQVLNALKKVHAEKLSGKYFTEISDGEKQMIMLARAICQKPEIIILDEPTAYLDINHKIEFLSILRKMAREDNVTVIMSLHEIDLASKISDYIMCISDGKVKCFGKTEDVISKDIISELYGLNSGTYNNILGSLEFKCKKGPPEVFIISGNGKGIPFYRALQKRDIPFAAGILFENDIDCIVASSITDNVISTPAFEDVSKITLEKAKEEILKCKYIICAGVKISSHNKFIQELIDFSKANNKTILYY